MSSSWNSLSLDAMRADIPGSRKSAAESVWYSKIRKENTIEEAQLEKTLRYGDKHYLSQYPW